MLMDFAKDAASQAIPMVLSSMFGGASNKVSYNSDPRWGTSAAQTDSAYQSEAQSLGVPQAEGRADFLKSKGRMSGGRAGKIGKWTGQTETAYQKALNTRVSGRNAGRYANAQTNTVDWSARGLASGAEAASHSNAVARDTNFKAIGRGSGAQRGADQNAFYKTANASRAGQFARDQVSSAFPELNPYELASVSNGGSVQGAPSGGNSIPALQKSALMSQASDQQARVDQAQSRMADQRYKLAELANTRAVAKTQADAQILSAAVSGASSIRAARISKDAQQYTADTSARNTDVSTAMQETVARINAQVSRDNVSDQVKAQRFVARMNYAASTDAANISAAPNVLMSNLKADESFARLTWEYVQGRIDLDTYTRVGIAQLENKHGQSIAQREVSGIVRWLTTVRDAVRGGSSSTAPSSTPPASASPPGGLSPSIPGTP